jgi:hypothetical protein
LNQCIVATARQLFHVGIVCPLTCIEHSLRTGQGTAPSPFHDA